VSRDNVVGIAISYGLDGPGIESRQGKTCLDRNRCSPGLLFSGYRGSFPGVKQPGREVVYSPTYSSEVKNEWNYTPAPPIPLIFCKTEISTVLVKVKVFWNMLPCVLVYSYRCFGGTGCLFLQRYRFPRLFSTTSTLQDDDSNLLWTFGNYILIYTA
jgi:hypothetical protein